MVSSIPQIKRAQKESLIFREISQLFMQAGIDDPKLQTVTINRVSLSPDKGHATVFFYTPEGEDTFNSIMLPILTQYKPSLRKALAGRIRSRYTPELVFAYDKQLEKQIKIETLLEQIKETDSE